MKEITATEITQREVEFWEKYKKSESYLRYVAAEDALLERMLNRMLELENETKRKNTQN